MTEPSRVLVLQSHRWPLPAGWLGRCLASVKSWAQQHGYQYRFEDDALFERLDPELRRRVREQPVIAADLARLTALEAALTEGFGAAVWLDADVLVFDPPALCLPDTAYALGRQIWVQPGPGRRLRTYVGVHNAFLLFRAGNPFLTFYRHAAERIVLQHAGPMVPQLVGPKLLGALHNLVQCPVAEAAGMLSPAVGRDLLAGSGPALAAFRDRCRCAPAALNLCGSLVGREIDEGDVVRLVDLLVEHPQLLTE